MRIALIGDFDTYAVRGLERPAALLPYHLEPGLNLLRGLREIGQRDVHLVILTSEVKAPAVEDGPLGTVHRLPKPPLFGCASFFMGHRHLILRELAGICPDVVHGQGTEQAYAFTAVTSPYPNVITIHGIMNRIHKAVPPRVFSLDHILRWMEKQVVRRARDVVCISPAACEFLQEQQSPARCHMIPNAVTPCFFDVHPNLGPRSDPLLLFVGTIYPLKGLLQLVEALSVVRAQFGLMARLRVIGSTGGNPRNEAYFKQVRRRVGELGLEACVDFCGVRSAAGVAAALTESAALVLPSFQENAPMCVAEAMAAGVPVIATRVGGVPNIVDDGVTGLLVTPGRTAELARAICQILSDTSLRLRLAEAARVRALERHTPGRVAEKTRTVYAQVQSMFLGRA